jgi:Tfp pilus assembly protein PilX
MKMPRTIRLARSEAGIALLISIFVLLLISVVAIALIVSSGTETSLAGNYRSSTAVYYAALSGIEEARGRLAAQDPNAFKTTWTTFYPTPGSTLPIGTVGYVLNPGPADPPDPRTAYPDTEYDTEFGAGALAAATVKTTLSIWNKTPLKTNLTFPGPMYKWARINAVSEKSLNLADTYPFLDGTQDPTPLYYDGTHLNDTNSGRQVFEITALAVMPNASGQNSQKLLQYLVAPGALTLPSFLSSAPLAALSISGSPGNSPTFHAPNTNAAYAVQGNDSLQGCSGNPPGTPVAAIGLFGDYSGYSYNSDLSSITAGIPTSVGGPPPVNPQLNYTGQNPAPDVEYLASYPASMMPPAQVDAIAQNIIQNADAVFVPAGSNSTQTAYLTSLGMSPTNIMTVIANGNLDVSNWTGTGYGLLLVIGKFTYDPSATWNGIVLVIGQGQVDGDHLDYKQINGAMFVAKTRDSSGNLLTGRIGGASVAFLNSMQGNGVRYSSCWVQKAQPVSSYKILSFHEISQ